MHYVLLYIDSFPLNLPFWSSVRTKGFWMFSGWNIQKKRFKIQISPIILSKIVGSFYTPCLSTLKLKALFNQPEKSTLPAEWVRAISFSFLMI